VTWNYRMVEYADGSGFGLHEVHYRPDGSPKSMTAQPAAFVGDTPEEVRSALVLARMDASRRPILKESVFTATEGETT
jgi:hypothetical protein